MKLSLNSKEVTLEKVRGYWITPNCKSCEAEKILKTLTKKAADSALHKISGTQSLGDRLCRGLKGAVWILKQDQEQVWSVCEFDDKSALLTDDLAGLYYKLGP